MLQDETDDSPFRKAEKLRKIWSSRDLYGRRRMLRSEQQSFSHQRPRHRDWSADKPKTETPPTVAEGEPSGKGKVGSGLSGRGWGGGGGVRPVQGAQGSSQSYTKDKSQITCYNCNEKGHYKSECPKPTVRMARISSPKPTNKFRREGVVNGYCCSIILDTGADITAVPASFISESQYTGETVDINVANAQGEKWKLARVRIQVDGFDGVQRVCVLPKDAQDVLLGVDHPLTASMSPKPSNVPCPSMRAVTRRQRKVAENELAADIAADKVDEVNVTSLVEGSERTNRQVETGNEEVEGETPSDSFQLKECISAACVGSRSGTPSSVAPTGPSLPGLSFAMTTLYTLA